jgi:hypothetical protein
VKAQVLIAFDFEGFHRYEGAPAKVDFLSARHRHTFKVKCAYRVDGLNRDVEIFLLRDHVKASMLCAFEGGDIGGRSCEMLAAWLVRRFKVDGMIWAEVWEESTGGARVEL